jgi:hypothetical protein
VENVLCPNTAQLLPAVEEEVIATSEASYVWCALPSIIGQCGAAVWDSDANLTL